MPKYYLVLFQFIIVGFFSSSVIAEENSSYIVNLDTVVVTDATTAVDYPINAPLNLTVFDLETINELHFTRVQDIAQYVPSYNLINAGANGFSDRSSIRGLTNTPIYTTPAVVHYVDDIPYLSSFSHTNQLVGVDSIEIYKGPQGGLFGKNSYAGVINIKSRRPINKMQGHVSVDKGDFDSLNVDSYLSGALVKDKLYFSLGGVYSKHDGYLHNTFLNTHPDSQDHLNGQVSLFWTPAPSWEVDLRVNLQDFNDGSIRNVSLASNNIYQIQSEKQGKLDQKANSQGLKISYQNDHYEVLSVTSRRDTDTAYAIDVDFLPQPLFFTKAQLEQQQWSQEFRIKSLDESLWRWSLGLFYSTNDISGNLSNTILQLSDNLDLKKLDETTYAAFGQITYQGFDELRVILDVRVDTVEKEINRNMRTITGQISRLKNTNNDFFVSPKLTLDYILSSQVNAYYTTGLAFKPGGFSAQSGTRSQYDKETMWHNEIGVKSTWLNNKIKADFALFYYAIENYQLEEVFTPFDYSVVNAHKVSSYGAEINLGLRITDTFQINSGFAYTQIEFDDYVDPFTGEKLDNNNVPYVPRFNINVSGIFNHPLGFFTRLDLLWTGKTYFDTANSDTFSEQDYAVLNAFIGYKYKSFSINAYVKNLTGSEHFTYKVARANFGAPGDPRTFGARVSYAF